MNRGFTLIEILIAVLILGFLMTTLFTSFQSFISSSTAVNQGIETQEQELSLLGLLERDLFSLHITLPPRYHKPESPASQDPFRFQGTEESVSGVLVSRLGFASLNHLSLGKDEIPGLARITYYAKPNKENGMDLCRSDRLRPFDEPEESSCDPILVRNISGFDVSYTAGDEENEATTWDSDSAAVRYTVPVSVKFKITINKGSDARIIETEIALPFNREILD